MPHITRPIQRVPHSLPLLDLLNRFSKSSARLALVVAQQDPLTPQEDLTRCDAMGIITLEDVIEELIQEEILDETDQGVDVVAMLAHKFALERTETDLRRGRSRDFKRIISSAQVSPPRVRARRSSVGEVEEETWKPIALASLMKRRHPAEYLGSERATPSQPAEYLGSEQATPLQPASLLLASQGETEGCKGGDAEEGKGGGSSVGGRGERRGGGGGRGRVEGGDARTGEGEPERGGRRKKGRGAQV